MSNRTSCRVLHRLVRPGSRLLRRVEVHHVLVVVVVVVVVVVAAAAAVAVSVVVVCLHRCCRHAVFRWGGVALQTVSSSRQATALALDCQCVCAARWCVVVVVAAAVVDGAAVVVDARAIDDVVRRRD